MSAWRTGNTFWLHDAQTDIIESNRRFIAGIAGTGGGKTAIGPVWLMDRIAEHPRGMWLVIAPTYPIMARATAPTLVTAFADTKLEGWYIPSRNQYRLPDGGKIWFVSADRPQGLEGGQFNGVWIDEAGQISYDAWVAIQARVGQKQGRALLTTTPYGLNWLYKKFYKPFLAGDNDYYVRQWPSHLNPVYPREEYDRMKRTLSPQRAAMRYDGEFVKLAGLVYPNLEDCFCEPYDPPPGRLVGGIDFGWTNPFCALGATRYIDDDGQDVLYIWYERYKRNVSLVDHAAALPEGLTWWADPSRPDSIADLRRGGHTVRGAYNDIMLGVDAVNSRINTGRLRISNQCRALKAELEQYRYPEKDEEVFGEKPIDEFNHACDAVRYLTLGLDRRERRSQKKGEAA